MTSVKSTCGTTLLSHVASHFYQPWTRGSTGLSNVIISELDAFASTTDPDTPTNLRKEVSAHAALFISKMADICKQICALAREVCKTIVSEHIEYNTIACDECSDITTGRPIPGAPLRVFSGKLSGVSGRVLKDHGCSTNVIL